MASGGKNGRVGVDEEEEGLALESPMGEKGVSPLTLALEAIPVSDFMGDDEAETYDSISAIISFRAYRHKYHGIIENYILRM